MSTSRLNIGFMFSSRAINPPQAVCLRCCCVARQRLDASALLTETGSLSFFSSRLI